MKLDPPPLRRTPIRTDPSVPRLPSPSRPLPPERPLFDKLTEWAAREEHQSITLALGLGMFCGSILWLLWALH